MTRPTRLQKTPEELKRNLHELFNGLVLSSRAYDEGFKGEASRLAALIYIAVHDYGRSAVSLLTQLGRKNIKFVNTGKPINPHNMMTEMPLIFMRLGGPSGFEYFPILKTPEDVAHRELSFTRWWDGGVLRDENRRHFSRKNIIFHLRNGEGGGHVSPTLDQAFDGIQRHNAMGWLLFRGGKQWIPEYGPLYATTRQIAWELEQTLKQKCGDIIP